jgi:hypothetical protein
MVGEDKDFFGMSDEDFAKLGPSSLGSDEGAAAPSSASEEEQGKTDDDTDKGGENGGENGDNGGDDPAAAGGDPAGDADAAAKAEADKAADEEDPNANLSDEELTKAKPPSGKEPAANATKTGEGDGKDKIKNAPKEAAPIAADADKKAASVSAVIAGKNMKPEDLVTFYDQVMKPFKANGREIKLRNPEEAIRLMQMGAGYGRKLQDMQPHLKTLRMLEKNNLLDEGKLSYLIDLDQKNPEAIKKLIKDAGIDPLDMNMDDNSNYRLTNHSVSDTEVAFSEALKDVATQPGGRETIQQINSTWDKTSKEAIWAQPELLRIIQSQKENGLFNQISAEMERKKMLGEIAPNTPFLEAYKIAGDALASSNSLILSGSEQQPEPKPANPTPAAQPKVDPNAGRVLGTRAAAPKSGVTSNAKAKAAASPQSSSRKAKETVNPLDMADDEFLKQFNGRI